MTVVELKELMREYGIGIGSNRRKADLIAALEAEGAVADKERIKIKSPTPTTRRAKAKLPRRSPVRSVVTIRAKSPARSPARKTITKKPIARKSIAKMPPTSITGVSESYAPPSREESSETLQNVLKETKPEDVLNTASKLGNELYVDELLESYDFTQPDLDNALLNAIFYHKTKLFNKLLEAGANPENVEQIAKTKFRGLRGLKEFLDDVRQLKQ